jgi:hypothetical protein
MPFNINPSCPAGQKTVINWQFPGQAAKTNDQGDDYRVYYGVSPTAPRASVGIIWNADQFKTNGGACYNSHTLQEPYAGFNTFNNVRELPLNPVDLFVPEPTYYNSGTPVYIPGYSPGWRLDVKTYASGTNNAPNITTQYASRTDNACYITPGSLRNVAYFFYNNSVKYVIAIYKNGQVIATDSGNNSPTISWNCGQSCPPNTCDVLCDNTICCYGADGISVFSYSNT